MNAHDILLPNQSRCSRCGTVVRIQGLNRHIGSAKCIRAGGFANPAPPEDAAAANAALNLALNFERQRKHDAMFTAMGLQNQGPPVDLDSNRPQASNASPVPSSPDQDEIDLPGPQDRPPSPSIEHDNSSVASSQPRIEDIKMTFHPSSQQAEKIIPFDEYASLVNKGDATSTAFKTKTLDRTPWQPFRSRLDFELAEVILDTHMNRSHTQRTIALVKAASRNSPNSTFSLQSADELTKIWDAARSSRAPGFLTKTLSVPYSDDAINYNIYWRPIWDWCRELLTNEDLVSRFTWDAQRLYKFDGENFERFIDEPWTAQAWWDYQSSLPETAKPLCLILYADETRLSSFGTAKGHPVVCRCANLPVSIRNGKGVGGARTVGWLPIPPEPASEVKKTKWVNHKREVWHTSIAEIIASIKPFAKLGTAIRCGDGITRQIFPTILILSGDYDEQSDMALTRGVRGNHPCPVCLVPRDEQSHLSVEFPLQTSQDMQEQLEEARGLRLVREREVALRDIGLRNVENAFWDLDGMDVYSALSWDRLHAYHIGLFEDHLLTELRDVILKDLGRNSRAAVDQGLVDIPRWPNLYHFDSLASTSKFADGTKFEDLSKVIIFASQHVLTEEASEWGFALLQLIRSYIELDLFMSLTVQTESTIAMGREELKTFERLLETYKTLNVDKDWDFPKCHSHQHAFLDILRKGVTRNYNTKPDEQRHGPIKKFYQNNTNFKNFAPQILRVDEMDVISTIIRTGINNLDDADDQLKAAAMDEPIEGSSDSRDPAFTSTSRTASAQSPAPQSGHSGRVQFGSRLPEISIKKLQEKNADEPAFNNILGKFRKFLSAQLQLGNRRPTLESGDLITPFQMIKVQFVSVVDWRTNTSILRAHPEFHNHSRYDHALVKINSTRENDAIFVQVLGLFELFYKGERYETALVLPLDQRPAVDQVRSTRDRLLRLTRLQPCRMERAVVINAESIIRGGLLADDYASDSSERLLVNFTDQDMWMRMKSVMLRREIGF